MEEIDLVYCPRCGTETKKEDFNLRICLKCDYKRFLNPRPTSAVILENDQNQILLVVRRFDPKKGTLDLPGGFIDIGEETAEDSARREIKEELGIDIDQLNYFGTFVDKYEFSGVVETTISLGFSAKFPEGQSIIVSDDISDAKWFDRDKVPYGEIGFEKMRKAIKTYVLNRI